LGGLSGSGGGSGVPIVDDDTPPVDETEVAESAFPGGPEATIDATQSYMAILRTNRGDIEIQLSADAPVAVNSFVFLASEGFYDDTFFFFVDRDFVAQAGDPTCSVSGESTCTGVGGPGYSLPIEDTTAGHERWAVVAPWVVQGEEVHGSQFRILFNADERLDGKETVFGRVVAGQEILEALSDFVPCSVTEFDGCDPDLDVSSVLLIEEVIIQPV
jgi:cyclophilin family peptidyl-prolyl cis-trans isomerase